MEVKSVNPKEINPEYSKEELILKLQYFDYLRLGASSLEKTLMLGRIEGNRRRGRGQKMEWLDSITSSMEMPGRQWRTEEPGILESLGSQSQS